MHTSQLRLLSLPALLIAASLTFNPASSNATASSPESPAAAQNPSKVGELLRLTNNERLRAGLPTLSLEPRLSQAAQQQAWNMASSGEIRQVIDGMGPAERVSATGYSWRIVGENLAQGGGEPAKVLDGWMKTDGHQANILSQVYTEMGVGYALAADGKAYWVQVFARS